MKYNITNAYDNLDLYLDLIYFSGKQYLSNNKSVRLKSKKKIVASLKTCSPTIIGSYSDNQIYTSLVKDIYKSCYKNNRKRTRTIKLSRTALKKFLALNSDIHIGGLDWL